MFPFPKLALAFGLGLLLSTGLAEARRSNGTKDPLKTLVAGLEEGRPALAKEWAEVLKDQPTHTTTDLWNLFEKESSRGVQESFRALLLQVSAINTEVHEANPLPAPEWHGRLQVSLEILALAGSADQVDELLRLLAVAPDRLSADPASFALGSTSRELQLGLTAAIDRDAESLSVLGRHYGRTAPRVDTILLRAVGDSSQPETANRLSSWLGIRPLLDATLLNQIAGALRDPSIRIDEMGLKHVRPLMGSSSLPVRRSAIRALGFADDVVSIEPLIANLADPAESIRGETLQALQRITAMTIEGNPDRWRVWFRKKPIGGRPKPRPPWPRWRALDPARLPSCCANWPPSACSDARLLRASCRCCATTGPRWCA